MQLNYYKDLLLYMMAAELFQFGILSILQDSESFQQLDRLKKDKVELVSKITFLKQQIEEIEKLENEAIREVWWFKTFVLDEAIVCIGYICRIHFHCMKKIPESLRPVRAENSSMFVHTELLFVYIILISLPLNFIWFDFLETFQIIQYQYLNSLISTLIHMY